MHADVFGTHQGMVRGKDDVYNPLGHGLLVAILAYNMHYFHSVIP